MADQSCNFKGGIVVSEFGMPEPYESLRTDLQSIVIDPLRSRYYKEYLQSILMAMAEGVNVVGTLAWSIFDNFEWDHGYSCRFGVQVSCFRVARGISPKSLTMHSMSTTPHRKGTSRQVSLNM